MFDKGVSHLKKDLFNVIYVNMAIYISKSSGKMCHLKICRENYLILKNDHAILCYYLYYYQILLCILAITGDMGWEPCEGQ